MKTSKLWLRNTSRYPDHEAWPLIKAAYESVNQGCSRGQEMPRIIVKLTNCSVSYRGRAHWIEYDSPGRSWKRILVRVGAPDKFPRKIRYARWKSDMPEFECRSYRECIVMVTAHEMEHCLGASGRQSGEFRCEMAAWDAIDYFRKHQSEIEAEIAAGVERLSQTLLAKAQRLAESRRPEVLLAEKFKKAQEALGRWQRKSKLAASKVKKYCRAVARYQKRIQDNGINPIPSRWPASAGHRGNS